MSKFAPIAKRVAVPNDAERTQLYDTKTVNDGTSSVSFFDPNASGGKNLSNYEENPLPGNYRRVIHQLGFELTAAAIEFATAAEAEAFLNNINNAYVEIWTGDTRCNYMRALLTDVLSTDVKVTPVRGAGADVGDTVLVQFASGVVTQVIEPIVLEPNERLYVELFFPNAAGLPADDEMNGTPGNDLAIRAKLGVSRWSPATGPAGRVVRNGQPQLTRG